MSDDLIGSGAFSCLVFDPSVGQRALHDLWSLSLHVHHSQHESVISLFHKGKGMCPDDLGESPIEVIPRSSNHVSTEYLRYLCCIPTAAIESSCDSRSTKKKRGLR